MPDQEITGAFLYNVWKRTGKSKREVGEMFGLTYGQCAGRIWRYEQQLDGAPPEKPGLFNVVVGAPLELEGDFVVLSDIHAPTTDLDMARLVVPTAERYGVRQLIIAGDLLNVDWLSAYPVLVPHPSGTDEIEAAKYLLEEWLRYFDRIVIAPGNHEDRFLKLNAGSLRIRSLVRLLTSSDKVEVTDFDHVFVHTPNGRWMVTHGKNYSVNQLVVADQLAQKFQSHVIMGHQHHLAIGWDRWKRYIVVDNGGLFDVSRMAYVQMRASKSAGMMTGFSILRGGYPHLFGPPPFTDWATVLPDADAAAAPLRAVA